MGILISLSLLLLGFREGMKARVNVASKLSDSVLVGKKQWDITAPTLFVLFHSDFLDAL